MSSASLCQERMESLVVTNDRCRVCYQNNQSRHWIEAETDKASGTMAYGRATTKNATLTRHSFGTRLELNDFDLSLALTTGAQRAPSSFTTSPHTHPSETYNHSSMMPERSLLRTSV